MALQKKGDDHIGSRLSFDSEGSDERHNTSIWRSLLGNEQEETGIISKLKNPGKVMHIVVISSNTLQQIGGHAWELIEEIQQQLEIDVSRDLGKPCDLNWVQINPPVITDEELIKIAKERWGGKIMNTRKYRILIKSFVSSLIGSRILLIREALAGK